MQEAYKRTIKDIYKELDTSDQGISSKKFRQLQKLSGKNVLIEKDKKTKLQIFLSQFKNIMVILLSIVGVLSLFYAMFTNGDYLEPIVILGTTLINCFMGFLQEY